MRPIKTSEAENTPYVLVGRADVAEVVNRTTAPGYDQYPERCMSGLRASRSKEVSQSPGAVYVALTLRTLQLITASINT